MEDRKTINKFGKSVGGSIKSLMGGGGRTYFVLEHKTATKKHRVGESTTFTSDYIELGRGSRYTVSFGDDCPTVSGSSGPHAVIMRQGDSYVLKHFGSNPTLINGSPVAKEFFLKNGDEIQLSVEGPKLSFLTPPNNTVGSLPLSIRMRAVSREALKPYRQAILAIAIVFVAAMGAMGYFLTQATSEYTKLANQYEESKQISEQQAEEIKKMNENNVEMQKELKRKVGSLEKSLTQAKKDAAEARKKAEEAAASGGALSGKQPVEQLKPFIPHIYLIRTDDLVITMPDGSTEHVDYGWTGTGFLLTDGRFVTARHVTEPWYFITGSADETTLMLNLIANNGGSVKASFTAHSPDGSSFSFTSDDFITDRSLDQKESMPDEQGNVFVLALAPLSGGSDWATYQSGRQGIITFDHDLSANLKMGDPLFVLGYPFGMALQGSQKLQPMYSESKVGQDGLVKGLINITAKGFDHGNSGGPAFAQKNGEYVAVGIISAGLGEIGNIVPLSKTR